MHPILADSESRSPGRRIRKQSTRPCERPNRRGGSCQAPAIVVVKWAYRKLAVFPAHSELSHCPPGYLTRRLARPKLHTTLAPIAARLRPANREVRAALNPRGTIATHLAVKVRPVIPSAQFSLRRPRRSNGPVERTGGQAGYLVDQALDREAPLGSGESTRTTRNGVDFRNAGDTGCRRRLTRSGNCRIDAVSIGRDQLSSSCCGAVRKGRLRARLDLILDQTKRGHGQCPARSFRQGPRPARRLRAPPSAGRASRGRTGMRFDVPPDLPHQTRANQPRRYRSQASRYIVKTYAIAYSSEAL
jgi:hypothetical protein